MNTKMEETRREKVLVTHKTPSMSKRSSRISSTVKISRLSRKKIKLKTGVAASVSDNKYVPNRYSISARTRKRSKKMFKKNCEKCAIPTTPELNERLQKLIAQRTALLCFRNGRRIDSEPKAGNIQIPQKEKVSEQDVDLDSIGINESSNKPKKKVSKNMLNTHDQCSSDDDIQSIQSSSEKEGSVENSPNYIVFDIQSENDEIYQPQPKELKLELTTFHALHRSTSRENSNFDSKSKEDYLSQGEDFSITAVDANTRTKYNPICVNDYISQLEHSIILMENKLNNIQEGKDSMINSSENIIEHELSQNQDEQKEIKYTESCHEGRLFSAEEVYSLIEKRMSQKSVLNDTPHFERKIKQAFKQLKDQSSTRDDDIVAFVLKSLALCEVREENTSLKMQIQNMKNELRQNDAKIQKLCKEHLRKFTKLMQTHESEINYYRRKFIQRRTEIEEQKKQDSNKSALCALQKHLQFLKLELNVLHENSRKEIEDAKEEVQRNFDSLKNYVSEELTAVSTQVITGVALSCHDGRCDQETSNTKTKIVVKSNYNDLSSSGDDSNERKQKASSSTKDSWNLFSIRFLQALHGFYQPDQAYQSKYLNPEKAKMIINELSFYQEEGIENRPKIPKDNVLIGTTEDIFLDAQET